MRLLLTAVCLSLLLPTMASAAPQAPAASRDCFLSTQWRGWSPAHEGGALYLRMVNDEVYRVQLTPGTRVRRYGGEFLVNQIRGSAWICSALDPDLAISDYHGFSRPIIATDLRKLTPEEVAAIPPEDRPY